MKYYSEHLKNINRVSLCIENDRPLELEYELPTRLCVKDSATNIVLPANIKPFQQRLATSTNPLRFETATTAPRKSSGQLFENPTAFTPPVCACGSQLINDFNVCWRPLPSEHWAELMDLWHCHKPAETKDPATNPLYQLALNGFHPTPQTCYYSDMYYLVHRDSILAYKDQHKASCKIINNAVESPSTTVKLWKWDLHGGELIGSLMGVMLKELIDAHATFTFEVNNQLLIWVLNANITYTSSFMEDPQTSVKILYGNAKELRSQRPDAEPVTLPDDVFQAFTHEIESINSRLPAAVRTMGRSWKLSLL